MSKKIVSIVAIIALVAVLGVCLAACNASSYEKKLEKADYEVTVYDKDSDMVKNMNEEMAKDDDYSGKINWMLSATKASLSISSGLEAGTINIIKFSKIADAKQYCEDFGGEDDNLVRKGSIVFSGDKDSIDLVA